jgi:hypothetical protein
MTARGRFRLFYTADPAGCQASDSNLLQAAQVAKLIDDALSGALHATRLLLFIGIDQQ